MACMDACVGRSRPAHRGAPPRRRQAALARVQRQDAGLHVLRSRSDRRGDGGSDLRRGSSSRTTSASGSCRSCATTSSTTTSGPTRRCVAGRSASARSASRISTRSTRPTSAARGPARSDARLVPLEALKAHVEKVLAEGAALSTRDLAIDGHVLMKELGIKPGRIIGEVLEALLEEVIADPRITSGRSSEMGSEDRREQKWLVLVSRAECESFGVAVVVSTLGLRRRLRPRSRPARGTEKIAVGDWQLTPPLELRVRGEYRRDPPDLGGPRRLRPTLARAFATRGWSWSDRGSASGRSAVPCARRSRCRMRVPSARRRRTATFGGSRGVDLFEPYEAYLEVRSSSARPHYVRLGRQAVVWGEGRLIGNADFSSGGRIRSTRSARILALGTFDFEALGVILETPGPLGSSFGDTTGPARPACSSTAGPRSGRSIRCSRIDAFGILRSRARAARTRRLVRVPGRCSVGRALHRRAARLGAMSRAGPTAPRAPTSSGTGRSVGIGGSDVSAWAACGHVSKMLDQVVLTPTFRSRRVVRVRRRRQGYVQAVRSAPRRSAALPRPDGSLRLVELDRRARPRHRRPVDRHATSARVRLPRYSRNARVDRLVHERDRPHPQRTDHGRHRERRARSRRRRRLCLASVDASSSCASATRLSSWATAQGRSCPRKPGAAVSPTTPSAQNRSRTTRTRKQRSTCRRDRSGRYLVRLPIGAGHGDRNDGDGAVPRGHAS